MLVVLVVVVVAPLMTLQGRSGASWAGAGSVRESVCPGRNKWFLPENGPLLLL